MSLMILDIFKLLNSKLPKDLYIPFKGFFKIWDDKSIFSISIMKFNFSIKSRSKSFNDFINSVWVILLVRNKYFNFCTKY